jgi:hypothetical protein
VHETELHEDAIARLGLLVGESRAIELSCERDCAGQCSVICPSAANSDVLLRHYVQ